MDLRCENGIKFGEAHDGIVEFKCRSTRCGHAPGVIVIHQFDSGTGELLKTQRFQDITSREEGKHNDSTSLRSA